MDPPLLPLDPGDKNLTTSSSLRSEGDSSDNDFSGSVLKYIRQMLIEEDMKEKSCMFHDPLALQATEKMLL